MLRVYLEYLVLVFGKHDETRKMYFYFEKVHFLHKVEAQWQNYGRRQPCQITFRASDGLVVAQQPRATLQFE